MAQPSTPPLPLAGPTVATTAAMDQDRRPGAARHGDLASHETAKAGRGVAETPKAADSQGFTESGVHRRAPGQDATRDRLPPGTSGLAPAGLENDSWNPAAQAAGDTEEAAEEEGRQDVSRMRRQ